MPDECPRALTLDALVFSTTFCVLGIVSIWAIHSRFHRLFARRSSRASPRWPCSSRRPMWPWHSPLRSRGSPWRLVLHACRGGVFCARPCAAPGMRRRSTRAPYGSPCEACL